MGVHWFEQMAEGSLGSHKPPEDLTICLKLEATPQDRVVGRLTRMTGDGPVLPPPIDVYLEVEVHVRPTDEPCTEFLVQDGRDRFAYRPRQHGDPSIAGEGQCGFGCPGVVGMSSDAALVEDQEEIGPDPVGHLAHAIDQSIERLLGQGTVRVVEQLYMLNTELGRRVR